MGARTVMTKEVEAIYEGGIRRPVKLLEVPDETRLNLIITS
jgi:predicted DNA-binding antitoxin AbrB/MazE fold protein